jgi:predicted HAD superfamily Cof-like phosphohydrolase
MTEHQLRIATFMKQAMQEIPSEPTIPEFQTLKLRARLIIEEALELLQGLGFSLYCKGVKIEFSTLKFHGEFSPNLITIADGCADLSVVNIGTLVSCGIDDESLLRLVDNNNLAKFGPGHYVDEHGKLVKPPNHSPPDVESLLKSQGWNQP